MQIPHRLGSAPVTSGGQRLVSTPVREAAPPLGARRLIGRPPESPGAGKRAKWGSGEWSSPESARAASPARYLHIIETCAVGLACAEICEQDTGGRNGACERRAQERGKGHG